MQSAIEKKMAGPAVARGIPLAILILVIFMLWMAGAKTPISFPPTIDPAIAGKRPKTSTPYFPSASSREVLSGATEILSENPDWSPLPVPVSSVEVELHSPSLIRPLNTTMPRYLRPFLPSALQNPDVPPA